MAESPRLEVYLQPDSALVARVRAFLESENAFDKPGEAEKRAAETRVVAFNESGDIVAVMTARARHVEQLANRFWITTVYVAPAHRHGDLAVQMDGKLWAHLEKAYHSGRDSDVIGTFAVFQTRAYQSRRALAVTPQGYVFVGRNRRGDNMRVRYFRGARLDGSPPDRPTDTPADVSVAEGYRIVACRDALDDALCGQIADFLQAEGAFKQRDDAERRAAATVVLAYDAAGNIAGQFAAERRYLKQLINEFWAVSAFVGKAHRQAHLARAMNLEAKSCLAARWAAGEDPEVIGLYMRMQSPRLRDRDEQAVTHYSRFLFIGRNARGEKLRVCYFDGARIDAGSLDTEAESEN